MLRTPLSSITVSASCNFYISDRLFLSSNTFGSWHWKASCTLSSASIASASSTSHLPRTFFVAVIRNLPSESLITTPTPALSSPYKPASVQTYVVPTGGFF
ncbi:unnamed protein product [Linum trigynum]|uniref:Uncharacterized protein n=1 Tax=Linum trigynum TaxID=586398 RepID=A0AAV2D4R9_9ROSI